MEQETIGNLKTYFEDVERRYNDGLLIPTSEQGLADRDRLLIAVTDLASMIVDLLFKTKDGNDYAASQLLDVVTLRTKLVHLLGKFEGFRHAQVFIVARSGMYSEYLT